MIVIHVGVKVRPEKRAAFLDLATGEEKVARGYPGCVQYHWSEVLSEQNAFSLYEEWETADAFNAYKATDHFKQLGEDFAPLMAAAPTTNYYQTEAYPQSA
jgi:quinol monooxygenase YgiN